MTAIEQARERLVGEPQALARDRQRRFHRFAPGAGAARARPAVVGLDNFATGHRRNLDEVRAAVTAEQWSRHASSRRHPRCRPPAGSRAATSTSCCTRRRWDRCRARSPTRSRPTRRTSTASSTCWSRPVTPACGASSTRRRARPMATTRRCPRWRTRSAGRCRPMRSPSSSTSSMRTCSRGATARRRSACGTSTSSAPARTRTAPMPR